MIENPSNALTRPWYREFWPWFLMLPPALAIAGGVAMVYLATQTPGALVVDDYSRIEELTREQFERDREARRLGLDAVLTFDSASGRIELVLAGGASFEMPAALILSLRHVTDPAADRELVLHRDDAATFSASADLAPVTAGRYRLELTDEARSWRLGADAHHLAGSIELVAQTDGGR